MISRIQITNLGAITEFDAPDLPSVVLIEGGNGVGKTSLLDALKYAAESGHDPDILHGNAESGQVIITFTDGNQIMARVNRKETTRGWKPKDGKRWTMNRTLIDELCKALAYDPLSFLKLKESDQATRLLEMAPIEVDPSEIAEAVGSADAEVKDLNLQAGMNGLEIIDATYDFLYKARTPLNTGASTQEAHASELENALGPPAPNGQDWSTEAARLQAEKESIEREESQSLAGLREEFDAAKSAKKEEYDKACVAIDTEIDAKIAALREEQRTRRETETKKMNDAVEYARGVANADAARIRSEIKPRMEAAMSALGAAQANAKAQQQAEGTRKAAKVSRDAAAAMRARAKAITEALERLKALKLKAASRLKIPGVRVSDGRIVREEDGALVPLRKWNTASQIPFCLRLARMATGKAGFCVVDDAEHFEGAKFEQLLSAAKKYAGEPDGMQFIIARVSAGDLVVKGA